MKNAIYSLLSCSPQEAYQRILETRGIPIKIKTRIITAILTDIREIDRNKPDPNSRAALIKKAGQSYDELLAKKRIIQEGLNDFTQTTDPITTG